MTFGFPQGQSDYEPEPGVRLGYVERGQKRFREIEIGWDWLESVGHVAPSVAPAPPLKPEAATEPAAMRPSRPGVAGACVTGSSPSARCPKVSGPEAIRSSGGGKFSRLASCHDTPSSAAIYEMPASFTRICRFGRRPNRGLDTLLGGVLEQLLFVADELKRPVPIVAGDSRHSDFPSVALWAVLQPSADLDAVAELLAVQVELVVESSLPFPDPLRSLAL